MSTRYHDSDLKESIKFYVYDNSTKDWNRDDSPEEHMLKIEAVIQPVYIQHSSYGIDHVNEIIEDAVDSYPNDGKRQDDEIFCNLRDGLIFMNDEDLDQFYKLLIKELC